MSVKSLNVDGSVDTVEAADSRGQHIDDCGEEVLLARIMKAFTTRRYIMENFIGQTRDVTLGDVDRGGIVVRYERSVEDATGQVVATLYCYPKIFSIRGTVDSTYVGKHNGTEEFDMHWVAADSLTFSEVLIQPDTVLASKTFLPQAGDVFSVNLSHGNNPYYTVIGFDFEDASNEVIKLTIKPLEMYSYDDVPF